MQGDCSGVSTKHLPTIPTPALAPLLPGQCVLLGREDMLALVSPDIWLDNLYLRTLFKNTEEGVKRGDVYIGLAAVPPLNGTREGTATRYMTRMTFQGDNKGPTVGVWGNEKVYVEGVLFCAQRLDRCLIRTSSNSVENQGNTHRPPQSSTCFLALQ